MKATRIDKRREAYANLWIRIDEKQVIFPWSAKPEKFYSLHVPDYICIIAETSDGRIPLVRQYRPAIEAFTWEFPSGTREEGETPEKTAFRELIEETGFRAASIVSLGTYRTDVGRLDNVQYGFHASGLIPLQNHAPEQGIELRLVTRLELEEMIETGVFDFALHLAVWERFTRKFPKSARP
jgi:ADP-ribose pyrophosphatase